MRGSRLHGNDRCKQCSNQRGYGVRGSCRWFGEVPPIHPYRGRMRGSRLHGNDGYEQCSNRRGYGVRGSCRWFGEVPPIHPYRGRMRGSRLHGNDGYEQCSNRRGYGVRGNCRWFEGALGRRGVRAVREQPLHPYKGASTQGCEVPVFTGTTGANNVAIGGAMA